MLADWVGKVLLAQWVTFCQYLAMDLLQRTYELIDKTSLTRRQVAAGAGVKIDWFAKFKQRRIESPGAPKVQAVYDFLRTGKQARAVGHGE